MPTYNFTIRASDESGAYADRDFSINVRNTIVDRYVVAMESATSIVTSTNTNLWTPRTVSFPYAFSSSSFNTSNGIVYSNGTWLTWSSATTVGQAKFGYSYDAVNWTFPTSVYIDGVEVPLSSFGAVTFKVEVLDGLFSFIGAYLKGETYVTRLIQSSDGINWFTPQGAESMDSLSIAAASNQRLTKANGEYYYSNGTSGTSVYVKLANNGTSVVNTTITGSSAKAFGVHYFNGVYITNVNGGTISTSIDGTTWVNRTLPSIGNYMHPNNIVYGNGRLVMSLVSVGSAAHSFVYTSTNGVDWVKTDLDSSFGTGERRQNLVYSNGKFILTCTGSKAIKTSYDGINWTTINPSTISANIQMIAAMDI